jgi:hypothetical protein
MILFENKNTELNAKIDDFKKQNENSKNLLEYGKKWKQISLDLQRENAILHAKLLEIPIEQKRDIIRKRVFLNSILQSIPIFNAEYDKSLVQSFIFHFQNACKSFGIETNELKMKLFLSKLGKKAVAWYTNQIKENGDTTVGNWLKRIEICFVKPVILPSRVLVKQKEMQSVIDYVKEFKLVYSESDDKCCHRFLSGLLDQTKQCIADFQEAVGHGLTFSELIAFAIAVETMIIKRNENKVETPIEKDDFRKQKEYEEYLQRIEETLLKSKKGYAESISQPYIRKSQLLNRKILKNFQKTNQVEKISESSI